MGNITSNEVVDDATVQSAKSSRPRKKRDDAGMTNRASKVVGDFHSGIVNGIKKLEEQDHPAALLLDSMCGPYLDKGTTGGGAVRSYYSEDASEDDSRTVSEEETTVTEYPRSSRKKKASRHHRNMEDETTVDSRSYASYDASTQPDASTNHHHRTGPSGGRRRHRDESSNDETEEDDDTYTASRVTTATSAEETATTAQNHTTAPGVMMLTKQPLASSFAKRCYFTKAGIGGHTQHYEGLTLTGNVLLMLAAAMKLKGCPTICDADLRRVEQTYPNQFSRLPDELLLSSGWRRISKYCYFSNKPVPDGIPFFHSKQRLHPSGGYYFLLAAAVGMVRPIDVERLNRDTLVLLETDYPSQCDAAPAVLIQDPLEWTLVDKFCFFSGGPINTEEDVYYVTDFDGSPIYMLAFLSPSLTPSELYKLESDEPLQSIAAVEEVESVYDLTERDFDDLKLYHLGPCRALPQYILQPLAWTKVLPPHFLAARDNALMRAQEYEGEHGILSPRQDQQLYLEDDPGFFPDNAAYQQPYEQQPQSHYGPSSVHGNPSLGQQSYAYDSPQRASPHRQMVAYSGGGHERYDPMYQQQSPASRLPVGNDYRYSVNGERILDDPSVPIDEAIASHALARIGPPASGGIDPPEDEPPSLRKRGMAYRSSSVSSADPSHRSAAYMDQGSTYQDGSVFQGSAYHDGSAYQGSTYQDGSAYDGAEPQHSYYQNEADHYEDEYPNEDISPSHFSGDEYIDEPPDYPHDNDERYEPHGEFQPEDDFDEQHPHAESPEYSPRDYDGPDENEQLELFDDDEVDDDQGSYDEISPKASDEKFLTTYSVDDGYDEFAGNSPTGGDENASPMHESAYSVPVVSEAYYGESLVLSPNSSADYSGHVTESNSMRQSAAFPPVSPRSAHGSEYSQSSAMRGAQELLRRNRQKRLEMEQRRQQPADSGGSTGLQQQQASINGAAPDDEIPEPDMDSPQSRDSGSTWQTGATSSEVTGGSSIWDGDINPDRSSRRALILQMARARMKSHSKGEMSDEKKLDHTSMGGGTELDLD